jgi:hypothetical protein
MPVIQRSAFVLLDVDRQRQFGKQQHSKNGFLLFSFSQREKEKTFRLMRIVPRSMCVVPEAGGSVCVLWYESTTAKMSVNQRSMFLLLDVDRKRRFGKQQHYKNVFFHFSFSQRERERTFRLMRIVPRSMCVVPEAGGSVCVLWYESTTAKMSVNQRSAFVLLDVGRKRRFGKQQHSKNVFLFFSFSQRENEKTFRLMRIVPQSMCVVPEAGCSVCPLW